MSVAFIACVERGKLEAQTLLLCRSLRRYGGRLADAPVHTYQPRRGTAIDAATRSALDDLGVHHHTDLLNTDFHDYPIGNKVLVCAHAEQTLEEEVLVFLDSDTVFTGEPGALELEADVVAAARPVDHKNRGSAGPGDRNDPYWQRLYELAGVSSGPYVEAAVSGEHIRAYFNAGLIAGRRAAGLFGRWRDVFLRIMEAKHIPNNQITFMDQLALAATFAVMPDRVSVLDWRYNYPLPKRKLLSPPARNARMRDLVHVHYHRWFNKPGILQMLEPPFDSTDEVFAWIDSQLPFEPTIDDPLRF